MPAEPSVQWIEHPARWGKPASLRYVFGKRHSVFAVGATKSRRKHDHRLVRISFRKNMLRRSLRSRHRESTNIRNTKFGDFKKIERKIPQSGTFSFTNGTILNATGRRIAIGQFGVLLKGSES